MNISEIRELCEAFAASQLNELELKSKTSGVTLRKSSRSRLRNLDASVAHPVPTTIDPAPITIKSPGLGRFLPSHPSTPSRIYRESSVVSKGEIVAFLQVGFILFLVISEIEGYIESVLVDKFAMVDFATPLFDVRPSRNLTR